VLGKLAAAEEAGAVGVDEAVAAGEVAEVFVEEGQTAQTFEVDAQLNAIDGEMTWRTLGRTTDTTLKLSAARDQKEFRRGEASVSARHGNLVRHGNLPVLQQKAGCRLMSGVIHLTPI